MNQIARDFEVNDLRSRISAEFEKHWELNDGAHRRKHFAEVEACGRLINRRLELGYSHKLILFVAYFHDLFAWSRNIHERMSFDYVTGTDNKLFDVLFPEERELVALACLEHRASFKGEYSNQFSAMMASADRGLPGNVEAMVERSVRYHYDALKVNNQVEARVRAVKHIKEKFGTGGYARYPELYLKAFGPELEKQRKEIDALV